MKSISKKAIKDTVEQAMTGVLDKLTVASPSKKTKKAINYITRTIRRDLKKQARKAIKNAKAAKNGKAKSKVDVTI